MGPLRSLLCIPTMLAASALAANAEGAVVSVQRQPNQVTITVAGGQLELRPIADRAIRVRFSDGKTAETPGFVLKGALPGPAFTVREDSNRIIVATSQLQAVVDRATAALSFQDAKGRVFLTEQPGSRVLQPVTLQGKPSFSVGQTFQSPDSEKLYGLGQYQDGLWNWRGIRWRCVSSIPRSPSRCSSPAKATDCSGTMPRAPTSISRRPGRTLRAVRIHRQSWCCARRHEQLTSAPKAPSGKGPFREGSYTTGEAGEYVFSIRDADRRNDVAILVDGRQIAGVTNMWTPRAIVGKVTLPAHTKVALTVRGGGKDVKLFARPLGDSSTFRSDYGQAIDYTVFYGPALDDVIAAYRAATGPAPLWPKWAFGLWQCRERYSSSKHLLDTAAEFRRRGIPVDLIIQDWQYWGPTAGQLCMGCKAIPRPDRADQGPP